jgi:radical SAM protein with 4Fe4S-binding SPASM domain
MAGMNWNFTEKHLSELLSICKYYDAFVRINVMKPLNKNQMGQILTPKQFNDGFKFLFKNCKTVENGETVLRTLSGVDNNRRCPCGISSFRIHSITPNGEIFVSPCVYLHDYKSSKDLLKNELSDIVLSDEFKVFRQRNANPNMIKGCEECKFVQTCGGGCAARSYLHNAIATGKKSFICKDPYCPIDFSGDFPKSEDKKDIGRLVHMDYLCTWIGEPK